MEDLEGAGLTETSSEGGKRDLAVSGEATLAAEAEAEELVTALMVVPLRVGVVV